MIMPQKNPCAHRALTQPVAVRTYRPRTVPIAGVDSPAPRILRNHRWSPPEFALLPRPGLLRRLVIYGASAAPDDRADHGRLGAGSVCVSRKCSKHGCFTTENHRAVTSTPLRRCPDNSHHRASATADPQPAQSCPQPHKGALPAAFLQALDL